MTKFKIQNSKFKIQNIWAFLLPIFLPLYVIRFNVGPLPTTLLEIFVVISFITWLIYQVRSTKYGVRGTESDVLGTPYSVLHPWVWPIAGWLVATLIAVFVAQDKWGAFGHWRAFMLEPILVFVMLKDVLRPTSQSPYVKDDQRATWDVRRGTILCGIATVTILLGSYAVMQYLTGWGIPHPWDVWPGRRATGIFGFPNGLSLFIVPFGVTCFIAATNRKSPKSPLTRGLTNANSPLSRGAGGIFLFATVLAGMAVVLAKSMGGIIAFGVGIVLTLIINKKTRLVGVALTALGLVVTAIVGYQIFSTRLNSSDIDTTIYSTKRWSSMVRVVIWQESIQIIKAHPLLGTGLRSYQTAVAPYHTATWMEIFPHPHNIVLMLWIETGILGLLAFIWVCATWVIIVLRPNRPTSYVPNVLRQPDENTGRATRDVRRWFWLVPLIVILVHGMVDMPYFKNDLAIQFWILAALMSLDA